MKVFIIISLFFISVLSLFSYNKIEFARDIDDYRIYGPLDNSGLSMLNDSIAVLYHCTVDDTAMVLKDWSPIAIANYNINTESVEFYYDRQSSTMQNWFYDPAFLTKDKSKVFAFGSFDHINIKFGDVWSDFYYDSVEVFNTSNGHIDSVFRIDGYKFANCSNMYNGNIAFMAIKPNDSIRYKNEIYVGELNPDTYSYTLTRTPLVFETATYPELITNLKIVKSYRPNIDEEVWVETMRTIPGLDGHEDKTYYEAYSFILDDSLQYRDSLDIFEKSKRQFIWRIAGGGLPGTLNHDSIYVSRGRLTNAFDIDLGINTVNVPSFTIGVDEKSKYFFCSGFPDDSSNLHFYYKIYDYKNNITLDSIITSNPLNHPLYHYYFRGGENFNISNDSIGVIIFRGSIWKFRLFSSTNGIDNNENEPELIKSIYPNPTLSTLNVEFNKELSYNDINKIKIIDVTGKSLNTNITYENSNIISINMENFSPGSYILIYNGEVRKFEVVK